MLCENHIAAIEEMNPPSGRNALSKHLDVPLNDQAALCGVIKKRSTHWSAAKAFALGFLATPPFLQHISYPKPIENIYFQYLHLFQPIRLK